MKRKIILAAREAKSLTWLRSFKEKFNELNPWLRRAFIHSSDAIPNIEREDLLYFIEENNDFSILEKIIFHRRVKISLKDVKDDLEGKLVESCSLL